MSFSPFLEVHNLFICVSPVIAYRSDAITSTGRNVENVS